MCLGRSPKHSPGYCQNEPYNYVTTVETPGFGYANPGHWSVDCSNPNCYGVPLYREFSVAGETQSTEVRMAGQSTAQRSTLTVNHGRYYLDTTVSAAEQSSVAGNLNVFDPGQTYYTFLLYAKPGTEQTYDLYVGPGFNLSTDVFAARAGISGSPTQFTPDQWPAAWSKQYDPNSGVLTVNMNMDFDEFKVDYNVSSQDLCKPQSFCSLQSGTQSCGCALPTSDGLFKIANRFVANGPEGCGLPARGLLRIWRKTACGIHDRCQAKPATLTAVLPPR